MHVQLLLDLVDNRCLFLVRSASAAAALNDFTVVIAHSLFRHEACELISACHEGLGDGSNSRSASRPAPALVASKSPPSA